MWKSGIASPLSSLRFPSRQVWTAGGVWLHAEALTAAAAANSAARRIVDERTLDMRSPPVDVEQMITQRRSSPKQSLKRRSCDAIIARAAPSAHGRPARIDRGASQ